MQVCVCNVDTVLLHFVLILLLLLLQLIFVHVESNKETLRFLECEFC